MEILLFLPLLLILMYVLLIRPQQQRVRQQQALVSSIEPGDEVVTVSGIVGHVEAIEEDRVYIEVAPGVTIAMLRQALGRKVEHPTEEDDALDDSLDDEPTEHQSPDGGTRRSGRHSDDDGPEEIAG
jgi:preprotein translocase subunit YajC